MINRIHFHIHSFATRVDTVKRNWVLYRPKKDRTLLALVAMTRSNRYNRSETDSDAESIGTKRRRVLDQLSTAGTDEPRYEVQFKTTRPVVVEGVRGGVATLGLRETETGKAVRLLAFSNTFRRYADLDNVEVGSVITLKSFNRKSGESFVMDRYGRVETVPQPRNVAMPETTSLKTSPRSLFYLTDPVFINSITPFASGIFQRCGVCSRKMDRGAQLCGYCKAPVAELFLEVLCNVNFGDGHGGWVSAKSDLANLCLLARMSEGELLDSLGPRLDTTSLVERIPPTRRYHVYLSWDGKFHQVEHLVDGEDVEEEADE